MKRSERLPDAIISTAIDWQMRLREQAGNAELHQQWLQWRQSDQRHELACQRLQQMGGMFHSSPLPDPARSIAVLQRAEVDVSRRRTLKLLGLGVAAGSAALLATQAPPAWHADFATRTGERRRVKLGNGAEVLLNTASALDVQRGELLLRTGEALVEGTDWRVRCAFASCAGRDASVVVREREQASEIYVQRGEARVSSASGQRSLQAGEALSVSAAGVRQLGKGPIDPIAWTRGLLMVSDIRLADFLAEAGRYRHGWLRCDAAVAHLRLSGVFRLDQPEAMLGNVTHLLPVKLIERTPWWVSVVPA